MARIQGASLDAIALVYRQEFGRFLHVASAITGNAEAGADAVQDAFASAVKHRRGYRGEVPLEAWLWRVVLNESRKQAARPAVRLASDEQLVDVAGTNGDAGGGTAARVRALIAGLPERQRLVLFLRYYADLDYQAIASALEIAPGTVGSTLNSAHAALRSFIQEAQR